MSRKQQSDFEQLASILENIRSMDDKPTKDVKAPPVRGAKKHKDDKS